MYIQLAFPELSTYPSMPVFDKSRCLVSSISYRTVKTIINDNHYRKCTPGTVHVSLGLYVDSILAGAITYSPFKFNNIRAAVCGDKYKYNVREFSRMFVYDWCGRNTESWFIGQSFKYLVKNHPEIKILVSYADSMQNHYGYIYQATNWLYTGKSQAQSRQYILASGKTVFRQSRMFRKGKQTDNDDLMSWKEIQEYYPGVKKAKGTEKYRYVYFLGNKSQRRKLRQALKWKEFPYPKRHKEID